MRKKSHLSLAQYLLKNIGVEELSCHKKAFYIGSILPDIQLSFLTKRHTIDETFEDLIQEIKRLAVDYDVNKGINSYFARHLGVVTHYLSDYCTYPHNAIFEGSMTEHIHYENDLKLYIRKHLKTKESARSRAKLQNLISFEDIVEFIQKTHKEYLKAIKEVKKDVEYIIELSFCVVDAILYLYESALETIRSGKRIKMVPVEYGNI